MASSTRTRVDSAAPSPAPQALTRASADAADLLLPALLAPSHGSVLAVLAAADDALPEILGAKRRGGGAGGGAGGAKRGEEEGGDKGGAGDEDAADAGGDDD